MVLKVLHTQHSASLFERINTAVQGRYNPADNINNQWFVMDTDFNEQGGEDLRTAALKPGVGIGFLDLCSTPSLYRTKKVTWLLTPCNSRVFIASTQRKPRRHHQHPCSES